MAEGAANIRRELRDKRFPYWNLVPEFSRATPSTDGTGIDTTKPFVIEFEAILPDEATLDSAAGMVFATGSNGSFICVVSGGNLIVQGPGLQNTSIPARQVFGNYLGRRVRWAVGVNNDGAATEEPGCIIWADGDIVATIDRLSDVADWGSLDSFSVATSGFTFAAGSVYRYHQRRALRSQASNRAIRK